MSVLIHMTLLYVYYYEPVSPMDYSEWIECHTLNFFDCITRMLHYSISGLNEKFWIQTGYVRDWERHPYLKSLFYMMRLISLLAMWSRFYHWIRGMLSYNEGGGKLLLHMIGIALRCIQLRDFNLFFSSLVCLKALMKTSGLLFCTVFLGFHVLRFL